MTTATKSVQEGLWLVRHGELEEAMKAYVAEFQVEEWDEKVASHFLELKFHLVRGLVTKEHIEELLAVANGEEVRAFSPGNPAGLKHRDAVSVITYKLGSYLLQEYRFLSQSEKSPLWMYDEVTGIWKPNGVEFIRHFVADYLGKGFKTHNANEVASYIHSLSYRADAVLGGPSQKLVVSNGLLNIETGELAAFSADEYHISALPVKYDPQAQCPNIVRFLQEILTKTEDQQAIVEHIGSCLHKLPYINIVMLLGGGANGKTVLLELVKAFLGGGNYSCATLQQLEERFQASQLFGKLANIAGDIPSNALKYTGMMKMLTGGDAIMSEFKNRDPFQFVNHSKLWFSANELPASYDTSDAFHRRLRVIEFTRQFMPADPGTVPKDVLLARLTTPEELSGLLNLALQGLVRLRTQGYMSGLQSIEESRLEYMRRSDSIQYFCYRFIEQDPYADPIAKPRLYEVYMKLCHAIGRKPSSDGWFAKRIRQLVPYLDEARPRSDKGEERVRAWVGIKVAYDLLRKEGVAVDIATERSAATQEALAAKFEDR